MKTSSELDPWRVICSELFNLSSYDIPKIIDKTGLAVDWQLPRQKEFSHDLRKHAYRPLINAAYNSLDRPSQLRVAHIVSSELANCGKEEALSSNLKNIGWSFDTGKLVPANADVSELFFPVGTQHDAYTEIKNFFKKQQTLFLS